MREDLSEDEARDRRAGRSMRWLRDRRRERWTDQGGKRDDEEDENKNGDLPRINSSAAVSARTTTTEVSRGWGALLLS